MTGAIVLLALGVASHALAAAAPLRHALEVRLDPAALTLEGTDRVTLHATGSVAFKLAPGFTVAHVVVDDRPAQVDARGGRIALGEGSDHTVAIEYHGRLAPLPKDGEAIGPIAGPEGSYLPAGWFPTFGDLFDYEVSIDVPDSQRALVPGRLTAETTAGGRYRATFTGVAPVSELPLFAGPYKIAETFHRGWRLRTYFRAEDTELADTYLERTAGYLDLYDGWIGAYAYPGFSVVSSPLPVGLAFPGMTYLGSQVLRLPFIPDTSLGHEVLHSWWGEGVGVDARDGNWAEGLTTFMADYTYTEQRGAQAAREQRLSWLREFAILPAAEDHPLDTFRGRMHTVSQATGYHKAAFVFVMLRDQIGSDAFATAVRRFWQSHRLSVASWNDLEVAFSSTAAGRSLAEFFAQWLTRFGAPRLKLGQVGTDGGRVSFTLSQDQPPYELAIPVEVETDGPPVDRTMHLAEVSRSYDVEVAGAPRTLAVDPDFRLFRRLDAAEIPPILREVAFDAAAVAVVAASDPAARTAAGELAASFFERQPAIETADAPLPQRPALVVGTAKEVTALLTRAQVEPAPPDLAGEGTARAWAARRPDHAPLAIVAADEAGALRAIVRPLPHYGGESFVVFRGSEAVKKGLWPPGPSPLQVSLPTRSPR